MPINTIIRRLHLQLVASAIHMRLTSFTGGNVGTEISKISHRFISMKTIFGTIENVTASIKFIGVQSTFKRRTT